MLNFNSLEYLGGFNKMYLKHEISYNIVNKMASIEFTTPVTS